jgi:hypothetical protein
MTVCCVCGEVLQRADYYAGRRRRYCSNRCKQAAKWQRQKTFPSHFVSEEAV